MMTDPYPDGQAPLLEALLAHLRSGRHSWHMPGHNAGQAWPAWFREQLAQMDLTELPSTDDLNRPAGPAKAAMELAAEAFGAASAFFMVGGTTASIQAMILSSVGKNEKLILPRNVHQSVINALVISGAVPVYINPQASERLGIALGMSVDDVRDTIRQNPDAKAIFVNNPTYYGICSNLREIVRIAHENGLKVLVDEAHGAHFYFGEGLPVSAMAAGADMAAVSEAARSATLAQNLAAATRLEAAHRLVEQMARAAEEALVKMLYTIEEGMGGALLTGVFGCGKTVISQTLLHRLSSDQYQIAYITNPQLEYVDLLRAIVRNLKAIDLPVKKTDLSVDALLEILEHILNNNARDGKSTVVIIDEAHIITDPRIFEGLRLLLNFQTQEKFLLSLLLLGQPELRQHIEDNKQLEQRLAMARPEGGTVVREVAAWRRRCDGPPPERLVAVD
mgnify:CR=1 FL=1